MFSWSFMSSLSSAPLDVETAKRRPLDSLIPPPEIFPSLCAVALVSPLLVPSPFPWLLQMQIFTQQLPSMDYLVTASGSGGTHAGISAAMFALRSPTKVVGISTRHPEQKQRDHIYDLAQKTLAYATSDSNLVLPVEAVVVKDQYVGPGYSLPTKGMEEAVTLFARMEGILLDPVYTGKAAAGLVDLVRSGFFPPGSNVLFLHTGGAPSLYHYLPIDHSVVGVAGAGSGRNPSEDPPGDEKNAQ